MVKRMKPVHVVVLLILLGIIYVAMNANSSQNTDCASITGQVPRDDCYHALAHATGNRELCNNITDAAEKEHCLSHIAGG